MEIQLGREAFLRALESTKAGLSPRDIIEQSTCFVFQDGLVITYNDEASCCGPSGLPKEFSGAVASADLLELLRKMEEENVWASDEDGQFWIRGKRRRAWHTMEAEIRLPFGSVEEPGDFAPLPEDFTEAVALVKECAGKDAQRFELTCVNLHPDWIEACDDFQACRWRMDTGVRRPVLVKRAALEAVTSLGVHEFAETDNWIHFRNARGFVLSCRRYAEDFPSDRIGEMLDEPGTPVVLPKGLDSAIEKANIYSQHTPDTNMIEVRINKKRLSVTGRGATGGYTEGREIHWKGADITFMIPPGLLAELIKKYNEISLSESTLRIDGGAYVYATSLTIPAEETTSARKKED